MENNFIVDKYEKLLKELSNATGKLSDIVRKGVNIPVDSETRKILDSYRLAQKNIDNFLEEIYTNKN